MKHSKESKDLMAQKRREYLKNNPDKHPWKRSDKFKSVPCENVKSYLRYKNIVFVDEWSPLDDKYYSIDIAFPDIKLGIEINGNQHYESDGSLKPYYQQRHNEIVESGWTLLELHYSISWNLEELDKLIRIQFQPDYTEYFEIKRLRAEKRLETKGRATGVKNRENGDKKWAPYIEIVKNCDIDFTKFGWGIKLAQLIGISPPKAQQWMRRHFPDTYHNICFKTKRKTQ